MYKLYTIIYSGVKKKERKKVAVVCAVTVSVSRTFNCCTLGFTYFHDRCVSGMSGTGGASVCHCKQAIQMVGWLGSAVGEALLPTQA